MSKAKVVRFIAAILASWLVMWIAQRRLPEPLVQGLAFLVMFLIIPISFSRDGVTEEPKATSPIRIVAATAGAVLVVILSTLFMGWK